MSSTTLRLGCTSKHGIREKRTKKGTREKRRGLGGWLVGRGVVKRVKKVSTPEDLRYYG